MFQARRLAAVLGLIGLLGVLGLAVASSAVAYPSGQTASATANTSFAPGQSFSITLTNFTPGTASAMLLPGGQNLGSVTVPASGTATLTGTIPSGLGAGNYTVRITGAGGEVVDLTFMVGSAGGVVSYPTSGTSGGGLAYTGAAVVGIGVLGAALLGGGLLLIVAGRKRRESSI